MSSIGIPAFALCFEYLENSVETHTEDFNALTREEMEKVKSLCFILTLLFRQNHTDVNMLAKLYFLRILVTHSVLEAYYPFPTQGYAAQKYKIFFIILNHFLTFNESLQDIDSL